MILYAFFSSFYSNCNRGVFRAFVIQVRVVLLQKCGQAPAVPVFAVVPHEVSPGRIRIRLSSQFEQGWPHIILICEELARDPGLHVVPSAQDVSVHEHWHIVTQGFRDDARRGIRHIRHKQEAALLHLFLECIKFQERDDLHDAVAFLRELAVGAAHQHAAQAELAAHDFQALLGQVPVPIVRLPPRLALVVVLQAHVHEVVLFGNRGVGLVRVGVLQIGFGQEHERQPGLPQIGGRVPKAVQPGRHHGRIVVAALLVKPVFVRIFNVAREIDVAGYAAKGEPLAPICLIRLFILLGAKRGRNQYHIQGVALVVK